MRSSGIRGPPFAITACRVLCCVSDRGKSLDVVWQLVLRLVGWVRGDASQLPWSRRGSWSSPPLPSRLLPKWAGPTARGWSTGIARIIARRARPLVAALGCYQLQAWCNPFQQAAGHGKAVDARGEGIGLLGMGRRLDLRPYCSGLSNDSAPSDLQ